MKLFDALIYLSIAIMYNLFVHNLASITYQDLQYEEKYNNSLIMIMVFGAFGIVASKILSKNKKYDNKYVNNGLYYGGILLMLSILVANWSDVSDELRLIMVASLFGVLIWYCYKIDKKNSKIDVNKDTDK
jgi:hypothetical protein